MADPLLVQKTSGSASTAPTVTLTNCVAGNTLLAVVSHAGVTPTLPTGYTNDGSSSVAAQSTTVYRKSSIAAGSNSITLSGLTLPVTVTLEEWSSLSTTDGSGTSATATVTLSAPTTIAVDLIYAADSGTAGTTTVGSGYSTGSNIIAGTNIAPLLTTYQTQTTIGTPTETFGGSLTNGHAVIVAYKVALPIPSTLRTSAYQSVNRALTY